jgi:subtilisin family serine protease
LILRADKNLDKTIDLSRPSAWIGDRHYAEGMRHMTGSSGLPNLTAEVVLGHEADAGTLRADPKIVSVADADSVFSLITPKARDASDLTTLKTAGALRMPEGLLAVNAHTSQFSGQGVTVAVLDTGIDATHPAFNGKQLVTRDFTGEGTSPTDVTDHDGHGTHCAGTVCGAPVSDVRVGVAPGVTKLCIGKVLGAKGGSLASVVNGMLWAVNEQKASVISMSLGYDLPGNSERLINQFGYDIALATQQAMRLQSDIIKSISTLRAFLEVQALINGTNVVFVAATGNESMRPKYVLDASLPAAELFSVGAVGWEANGWKVAPFSNGRAQIVAPGVDVVSAAVGGGWATMSGTSMATPHVAGVAALWVEKLRRTGDLSTNPSTLLSNLITSAVRQPLLIDTDVNSIGAGMVQAPM